MRYGLRRATAAFMFFIMLFTSIPTDTAVAASLSSQTSTNVTESVDNETAAAVSQNDETDDITPPSEDPSDEVIDAAPAEEDDLSLPEDAAPADPAEVEEEEDSPEIAEYDADDTKIHLNANGGSFSDGKDTIDTYPDDSISSSYVPTKKGWVFVKWTKDQGGLESVSGETYPRTRFTEEIAAGTTLYAQWTQDYWTVTYDFANGSYTGSDENLKVGGGYLQNYNTGYKKVTSQVYYVPKTHNLYTGYGYYYPTGSSLSNTDLHYSYKGWTLDGSTEYSISWNNEISGDMTIYVLYQKNKHIIKYHANDETAWFDVTEYDEEAGTSTTVKSEVKTSKETGTYTSMSRYYAPSTSNPRYVFAGWYLDAECTQTPTWYTDSSCETVKEEVTWGDSEYNYLKLDQDYELYAKWVSTNKVLTFDANGGYFSNSGNNYSKTETTKQYGGAEGTTLSSYTSVYNPYREDLHYTFTGWYADKDCTGDPVYTPYDGYSYTYIEGFEFGSSDTIYYAGWEKNRSVVTFNLNGGYITQYKDYTTGETVQNATATTVKYPVGSDNRLDSTPSDSYIKWEGGAKAFEAWYTAATGGSEVGYLYSKYFNEDTEIFAHWVDTYPIKFDANGGRIKTNGHYNDQSEYVYDYVADLTIRTGNGGRLTDYDKVSSSNMCWYEGGVQSDAKAFDGWFTDAEGGEKVDVDYSYSPTDAITLYAHWTPVYTINFDANGGKFRINGVWNSELQKTVYEYVDTVDAGKTGAYGKINGYPSNPVWYKDGAESEEKLFYSWFDGETKVDSISEYVPTGNTTLKAHWSDRYTITFNANGGKISGETSKTYYTNGQRKLSSYPYSSNMTAPEGQDVLFRGWYVSTDEDKTIISSSDIYNHVFDGDTTLMAYWQPKYTITFNADANGGYIRKYEDGEYVNKPYVELTTGANGTVEYYYYVPDDDDVKGASDKYRFEGWYTEKDGGTKITDWSSYEFTQNTTVYAHYSKLVTVTFNANGGKFVKYVNGEQTWVTEPREYVAGSDGTLNDYPDSYEVKRDDYVFLGWYTKETGGNEIASIYSYKFAEDTTVYAHWSKLAEITLDPNGGKLRLYDEYNYDTQEWSYKYTTNPIKCKMNQYGNFEDLPDGVEKDGYYFAGWYMTNGIEVGRYLSSYKPKTDVTLKARWTKILKITFDGGGATLRYSTGYENGVEQFATTTDPYTIDITSEDGYSWYGNWPTVVGMYKDQYFEGWYIGDKKINSDSSYYFTGDTTVKARFMGYHTVTLKTTDGYYIEGETKVTEDQVVKVPVGATLGNYVNHQQLMTDDLNKTFAGWYLDTSYENDSQVNIGGYVPESNVTLHPYFATTKKVIFNTLSYGDIRVGDTVLTEMSFDVIAGSKLLFTSGANVPTVDLKDSYDESQGYIFMGWKKSPDGDLLTEKEILNAKVTEDVTYIPVVLKGRKLIFHPNGGVFKYVEANTINGGYAVNVSTTEHLDARGLTPVVDRITDVSAGETDHYVLKGWYYDQACTTPADLYDITATEGYSEVDLYAGWAECYTVTLHTSHEGVKFENGEETLVVKVIKGEPYRFGAEDNEKNSIDSKPVIKVCPDTCVIDGSYNYHWEEIRDEYGNYRGQKRVIDSINPRYWYLDQECTKVVSGIQDAENQTYYNMYGFIPTQDSDLYLKWYDYGEDDVYVTLDANGGVYTSDTNWWDGKYEPEFADDDQTQWVVRVPKGITWDMLRRYPFGAPGESYVGTKPAQMSYNGWFYTDSGCSKTFDGETPIKKDTTAYCKWFPRSGGYGEEDSLLKVTLHAGEGYFIDTTTNRTWKTDYGYYKLYDVDKNTEWYSLLVPEIDDDTREFVGWYLDPECTKLYDGHHREGYSFGEYVYEYRFPKKTTDLYAKYGNAFQVEFDANGGFFDDDYNRTKDPDSKMRNTTLLQEKCSEGEVVIVSDYSKRVRFDGNKIFEGWYLDKACTEPADVFAWDEYAQVFKPANDTILYAKWVDYVKPESVTIKALEDYTLLLGDELKLTAEVKMPGDQEFTGKVQWFIYYTYRDSSVLQNRYPVELHHDGTVKALLSGTAGIYAEVNGVQSDYVEITVSDQVAGAYEWHLDTTGEITLYGGAAKTIKAVVTPAKFEGIVGPMIQWKSSNDSICSIEADGNGTIANLAAKKVEGIATITATVGEGKDKVEHSFTVNVINAVKHNTGDVVLSDKKGASATVNTTYISNGTELACVVKDRLGNVYDDVVVAKSGDPVVETNGKLTQAWTLTVKDNIGLESPSTLDVIVTILADDGMEYRDTVSLTINPRPMLGNVIASVASGTVVKGTRVYLNCETPDANIYYTLDGSDPSQDAYNLAVASGNLSSCATKLYNDVIVLNGSVTIKAYAVKDLEKTRPSAIKTFTYTVEDWGDAVAYKAKFSDSLEKVPEGIWFAIDGEVYTDNDKTFTTTESLTYTGGKLTLDGVEAFIGTAKLIENRDYTIKYANNTNVAGVDAKNKKGKSVAPTLTLTGKGNYASNVSFFFAITPADIDDAEITSETTVAVVPGKKVMLGSTKPTVLFKGKKLAANKDYELKYYEGENATGTLIEKPAKYALTEGSKQFTIVVSAKAGSNFTGQIAETVKVVTTADDVKSVSKLKAGNINSKDLKFAYDPAKEYTAELIFDNSEGKTPLGYVFVKKAKKDALVYGTDYTVEFTDTDNTSIGKHGFVIKGTGAYAGEKLGTYEITGTDLKKVKIGALNTTVEFTGSTLTLADVFNKNDKTAKDQSWTGVTLYTSKTTGKGKSKVTTYNVLTSGIDYDVAFTSNGKTMGTYSLVFTGKGAYTGTVKKDIKVKACNVTNERVTISVESITDYSKAGATPKVEVKDGSKVLREGIDYTLSYKNNKTYVENYAKVAAKKRPAVTVKGMGNYGGSYTANFSMRKVDVTQAITLVIPDVAYDSRGKSGYTMPKAKLMDHDKEVTVGKDKDIDPIAPGDYTYYYAEDTVLADGTEKYIGDRLNASDKLVEGTLIKVVLKVSVAIGDRSIRKKDSPYEAFGPGGTAELTGYYRFIGAGKDISKMTASIKSGRSFSFNNGEEVIPVKADDIEVYYTVKSGKTKTKEYLASYNYEIVSVTGNRFLGTATVTIRGRGEYGGTKKITFKINKKNL